MQNLKNVEFIDCRNLGTPIRLFNTNLLLNFVNNTANFRSYHINQCMVVSLDKKFISNFAPHFGIAIFALHDIKSIFALQDDIT